jgi:hypothetical protein
MIVNMWLRWCCVQVVWCNCVPSTCFRPKSTLLRWVTLTPLTFHLGKSILGWSAGELVSTNTLTNTFQGSSCWGMKSVCWVQQLGTFAFLCISGGQWFPTTCSPLILPKNSSPLSGWQIIPHLITTSQDLPHRCPLASYPRVYTAYSVLPGQM